MRVTTILARYGTEKYPDAAQQLAAIFSRLGSDIDWRLLIVDNALPAGFSEQLEQSTVLTGGDNSSWEFSAWDRGLEFLADEIWDCDLVNLATSAFRTLYTAYLDRFTLPMLKAIARRPVCLGHIDYYNDPVRVLAYRSQHWMRSSFLFLPPAEVKMLRSLVSVPNQDKFFGEDASQPYALGAPLSPNYRQYILDWLTGGDIGQGVTWHSTFALNESSLDFFRAKASAILNEHLLSIRLRAQGTRLVDATWLNTAFEQSTGDEVDWETSWRQQLAARGTDRMVFAATAPV